MSRGTPSGTERRMLPAVALLRVTLVATACLVAACSNEGFDTSTRMGRVFAEAWDDASPYERDALIDGTLTFGEYEGAVLAAVACARDAGAEIDGPYERADGSGLTYDYLGDYGDGDTHWHVIDRFDRECAGRYHWMLDWVWYELTMPTEAERQSMRQELVACLEDIGVDGLDASMGYLDVVDVAFDHAADAATTCFERFPRAFDEPWDADE